MSMQEFRRMAARIDQHMGLLEAQGVVDEHAIINRMMGYVPDLHKIWTERRKASRPYGQALEFPEHHKRTMEAILTNSATLECGYQAFLQSGCPAALRPQVVELHKRHRAWLADIAGFTNTLKAEGMSVQTLEYLEIALTQMIERVADLAKRSIAEN